MDAAAIGDVEAVKKFISDGADINMTDDKGNTALHISAWRRQLRTVRVLLSLGCKNDVVNSAYQQTALHFACISGELRIVNELIRAGANPNLGDSHGYTAIHHSIQNGHSSLVAFLIGIGVDIESKDKNGHTPFLWVCSSLQIFQFSHTNQNRQHTWAISTF